MSKLVNCKACNKEIAKGVKKCPSCGKDQRSWFGRHKILSFVGAVIILGGIGGAMGGGSEEATTTTSNVKTETKTEAKTSDVKQEEVKAFNVGDVVKINNLEYTLIKVEQKDKVGNEFLNKQVSEGGTFVAIQYKVKNVGDKPVGMFGYSSINLVDEKGTKYDSDIDASGDYALETKIDNSKIASDLNPDITITDTAVYEVSKEKYAQGKWYIQIDDTKIAIK